ncbi:hypothetical protein EJ04DRAFT_562965 [Polyplosphaeria fusca]|uniref:Uncharacterized protein n=1 Tax=Polyplosphaeria fusca TaxID=682080 RepID=A0A9P4R2X7_9PLEO|nr:hypothetical protein EJ04DRAFT_562965 [Polyplosphaeria fusca]
MAPRHGITVYGSAPPIDFSALAGTPSRPSRHLSRRAQTNAGGIVFIIILVLVGVGLIFCLAIAIVIVKNKVKRRKRDKQMDAKRVDNLHQYHAIEDMESRTTGTVQELPSENETIELQGDATQAPKTHEVDGFTAAPRMAPQPVELPPDSRG